MAAFTAKDVQALREKTGVGMMDCKKALVESDGDMEKAIDFCVKKLAAATKRPDASRQRALCSHITMKRRRLALLSK